MSREKPYYLRKPWDVLFQENKLDSVSPWDIDLVNLLTSLLDEMEKAGIDFRLAGTAVRSSVMIYHRKAEMLMTMEELPSEEEKSTPDVYLPPALPLPFRFEHTTTTVNDLIEALEKALIEKNTPAQPKLPVLPLPIPDFLDVEKYLLEIESRADALLEEIVWRHQKFNEVMTLSKLVVNLDWLESVRVFMMLLFLAQRMEIELMQGEEEDEVYITLTEDSESGE